MSRYYFINECLSPSRKRYWTHEEMMEKAEESMQLNALIGAIVATGLSILSAIF